MSRKRWLPSMVKDYITKNGCNLIQYELDNILHKYIPTKSKIIITCKCGHNRTTTISNFTSFNQTDCKSCTFKRRGGCSNILNESMNYQKFIKIKRLMEIKYKKVIRYRKDFDKENYTYLYKCKLCKINKPRRFFYNGKQCVNGKRNICKTCSYKNNNNRKISKIDNIDKVLKDCVQTTKYSSQKRFDKGRYIASEHDITIEDVKLLIEKQNNKCAFTGNELIWRKKHKYKASIDRINSDKGYTQNNIQLVSLAINHAKSNMSDLEFLYLVKQIYEYRVIGHEDEINAYGIEKMKERNR